MTSAFHCTGMIQFLWIFALLTSSTLAYREQVESVFPERIASCSEFLVLKTNLTTTARTPAGELMPRSEVNEKCDQKLDLNAGLTQGFVAYMTEFPTHVKFSMTIQSETSIQGMLRVNVLSSWGTLDSENYRALCDAEGNAYFNPIREESLFPQALSAKDWNTSESTTLQFEDEFDLNLYNNESPAPTNGQGYIITPIVCRIRPTFTQGKHTLDAREVAYVISIVSEMRHSWGLLHPAMWAELLLLVSLIPLKTILVSWYLYRCSQFRDHVMTQQKYFLYVSALSLLAEILFALYLTIANATGADTIYPTPFASAFFQGLRVMTSMAFDLLVLATVKGWGVVIPTLAISDQQKIKGYFILSLIVYTLSQILQPSVSLVWLIIFNETAIWVWIFLCLKHTKNELMVSSRLDRHAKLDMYTKLNRLLIVGLFLWFIILTVETGVIIIILNNQNRFVFFDIPPSLAWDVALLFMMGGFAWIWRPSPATAQFSYAFARQEDDGLDPITEFGLEST